MTKANVAQALAQRLAASAAPQGTTEADLQAHILVLSARKAVAHRRYVAARQALWRAESQLRAWRGQQTALALLHRGHP